MGFEEQIKKSDGDKPEERVEEVKRGVAEKELTKEEKEKNRKEFLEKETETFGKIIDEENRYIELCKTRQEGKLIREEYAEEQIKHSERVKTLFEQVRRRAKSDINFKIEEFLKYYSPEERQEHIDKNEEKIEKLKPDLEDLYKKHMAKENIENIEEENRILKAIKEGKF